ncbi:nicotinic acid mononucleotide adenylyltransferase [Arachidicoccus ginsenosidimutans]|uniref:nicotinate (nicotinamide) nucleotide adenylyltransferase n=1 Tax=Arachidicoccus sp. BS20 TaxID=1850526 RepID=UPI0007F12762|nr:nicotinate (nicotinamide) nucleotide adenylyltransferase [Arachidicoccus sp. BS20]ANI89930.1 nicotinic acid mononucleotide adenylyltransferase [Arachidicoccus sp. BS20]
MKVGLYFGSFNPIHIGHLIIAEFVANNTEVQQVWFVVSPQNPLKKNSTLLNEYDRLHLVNLAVEDNTKLRAVDIEFKLPKPSYTITTLTYLQEKYPQHEFFVILGSDSFLNLSNWKNYEVLVNNYRFIVYERSGFSIDKEKVDSKINYEVLQAPLLDISATFIREQIKQRKSIRYLVPEKVFNEIEINKYYF